MPSLVHYALKDRKCQTWLHRLSLKSGLVLIDTIKEAMNNIGNVIVILGAGDLDRCKMEDDFFRFEIHTALDKGYKLHFLLFDASTIEELFSRRKTPFLLKLFNKMSTVTCKFVSIDVNFEFVMSELASSV